MHNVDKIIDMTPEVAMKSLGVARASKLDSTSPDGLSHPEVRSSEGFDECASSEREPRFTASFVLELESAGSGRTDREEGPTSEGHVNLGLLLAQLRPGEYLKFCHRLARDADGQSDYDLRVTCAAVGNSLAQAERELKPLRQNMIAGLTVACSELAFRVGKGLGTKRTDELSFSVALVPVPAKVGARRGALGYVSDPMPNAAAHRLAVPGEGGTRFLNALFAEPRAWPEIVEVNLRVEGLDESLQEPQTLLEARKAAEFGGATLLGNIERAAQPKLVDAILAGLDRWLATPAGYRLRCEVQASSPVPAILLQSLGAQVFAGRPFEVKESRTSHREPLKDGLDLSACFQANEPQPAFLPNPGDIQQFGVRRHYAAPVVRLPNEGRLVAHTASSGQQIPVRMPFADRTRHTYIAGATGVGKSELLYNLILGDIHDTEHPGVGVIDPHGDLCERVLNAIPLERQHDVVLIDASDFAYPVGLNLLEAAGPVQQNFLVNELMKIMEVMWDLRTTGGPMWATYFRNALLLAMSNSERPGTLLDVQQIFESTTFRKALTAKCSDPFVAGFWRNLAERATSDASLSSIAPYIVAKISPFVANPVVRAMIGQPRSTVDFRAVMDRSGIVLISLTKATLQELDSQLVGGMIMTKLFSAALSRGTLRPLERKPFHLYVDEFQNLATDTTATMLSEARKFGLYLTMANQNLNQLKNKNGQFNVAESILSNVATKILFRLGIADALDLKPYFESALSVADMVELPDFHAVCRIMSANKPLPPFVAKMQRAPENPSMPVANEIRAKCRAQYARPRAIVEGEIERLYRTEGGEVTSGGGA